jgi:hypothetical protein
LTPEQERALLEAAIAGLDDALRDAFREVVDQIQAGAVPREAVQAVMGGFRGEMATTMASALSGILGEAVGTAAVLEIDVGAVRLSSKLYAEALAAGEIVEGVVRRHTQGFIDSRRLALDLFEGYSFRPPDAEPLQISPRNPRLPKYLREALLTDDDVLAGMKRAFAGMQVDNLATPALRAAYQKALEALDALEAGAGSALLEKRLQVAFFERMRYFASRIARTELHKAYAEREARLLMDDADVEFVQVRRAPGRGGPCICVLFTGRDLYGLGPGVYPKAMAPRPPFHPHCMCVNSPRLDLTGRRAQSRDEGGDAYFLRRLDPSIAGRVMGSQDKAAAVLRGVTPEAVVNASRDPAYRVQTIGETVGSP